MKKQLLFSIITLLLGFFVSLCLGGKANAQQASYEWVIQAGDTLNDNGFSITTDNNNNIYVTGSIGRKTFEYFDTIFNDSVYSNQLDIFIAKYNDKGNLMWMKQVGGDGSNNKGHSITTDNNDNVYITGFFRETVVFDNDTLTQLLGSDIFIAKYNSNGNLIWVKQAGGNGTDIGNFITTDNNGNVYLTGVFRDSAMFDTITLTSNGNADIFVAKYDSSGNLDWIRQAGGSDADGGRSIVIDNEGNVYLTGSFWGSASFGSSTLISNGQYDVFIAKYSATGNLIWLRQAGGNNFDSGLSITIDDSINIYITGYFSDTAAFETQNLISNGFNDIFIAKYDSAGSLIWIKQAGSSDNDVGFSITADSNSNIYVAGYFSDTAIFENDTIISNGNKDILLAKYDSNGSLIWLKQAGSNVNDLGRSATVDNNGNIYITGSFQETAFFDNDSLSSYGNEDIFIAKLVSCTPPVPAFTYKITSDSSGFDVNFVDFSTNAVSWFWDFGDGATDTIQSPTHIYTDSAIYNVCLIVSNSCGSDTLCELVNVWCELPAAGFTVTDSGLTVNFFDSSMNATSYFWNFGDGAQSTQQDTSHTYLSPGTYTVCLTVSNDCGFDTVCNQIQVFETGINESGVQSLELGVFPNPGRGVFILTINDLRFTNGELTIYNMLGSIILKSKIVNRKSEIDLSPYPAGIYHLQVMTDKALAIKKIVIVR